MSGLTLRVHQMVASSLANGPGKRAVIWLQGCTLACPGCFNPGTHPSAGGNMPTIEEIDGWLQSLDGSIDGLTISGGEPLQQLKPLTALLHKVRARTDLPTILFTGYTWQEVNQMPGAKKLFKLVDLILAGRYMADQRAASHLIGSRNKTVHLLSSVYTADDLAMTPEAEVVIDSSGNILLSGIDPLIWQQGPVLRLSLP
jgi:anaerobic ribonucleoside-triphosphate reductase activating protein